MAKCKNCNNLYNLSDKDDKIVGKWCPKKNDSPDIEMERECEYYDVMTKADRIRGMTNEKLAVIIMCPYDIDPSMCCPDCNCVNCTLEWLQSPVEE